MIIQNPRIQPIHNKLDRIQHALRASKSLLRIPRTATVHLVNRRINLVRLPKRPLQRAALKSMRAQQDVQRVPEDERDGHGEPEHGDVGRCVAPC